MFKSTYENVLTDIHEKWTADSVEKRTKYIWRIEKAVLAVFAPLSKVPQICPNFSLMTSYRKLAWFPDNGTTFFELSVQFYIRKHLLENKIKRSERAILISNHVLNFQKLPKSEFLPQMTSSGPTLSSSPIFAF